MYTDPECFSKQVNSQAALAKAAGLPFALTEYKEGIFPRCVPCLVNITEGKCPSCPARAPPSGNICRHACDGPAVHADTAYAAAVRVHSFPRAFALFLACTADPLATAAATVAAAAAAAFVSPAAARSVHVLALLDYAPCRSLLLAQQC